MFPSQLSQVSEGQVLIRSFIHPTSHPNSLRNQVFFFFFFHSFYAG